MKLVASIFTIFMIALFFGHAEGQSDTKYWTIVEHSGFPIFQCTDPAAALRLNAFLQTDLLKKLIDENTSDPFDKLQSSTFENYEVLRNDSLMLSLRFSFEGCGAYCEHYDQYLTFDSFSGNPLASHHFFDPTAWSNIKQSISDRRNSMLSGYIEHLKKQLANLETAAEDSDTWNQQLEMYEWCLQSRDTSYVNPHRFYVTDTSVIFVEERCSNHAMRSLDDLDEFHTEHLISDTSDLSKYGKYIFGYSRDQVPLAESC
jgi:hypothetical protein